MNNFEKTLAILTEDKKLSFKLIGSWKENVSGDRNNIHKDTSLYKSDTPVHGKSYFISMGDPNKFQTWLKDSEVEQYKKKLTEAKETNTLPKGQAYQLRYKFELVNGTTVQIDGKHDKYGYVNGLIKKDDEGFLYNVRGTGDKKKDPSKKAKDIPKL
jgi:hypothetical protein